MGIDNLNGTPNTQLNGIGANVLQILAIIGSGLSIIFLIILGIKYMLGSIEEKAQYKKTMFPYVIGAILVFGASSIAGVFFTIFS
ncbi:MAG: TrbC/VirB2 family protein [Clostridia bacterium]|nr:TrbC/VirB2 family protein [Clostridia bacterium]